MCKKTQFKYCPSRIDACMRRFMYILSFILKPHLKVKACCCGHGKYPMTVVLERRGSIQDEIFDLISGETIPRKKKFYKKDKQGYYYIPEVIKSKENK